MRPPPMPTSAEFSATADKAVAGQDLQFQVGANAGRQSIFSIGSTKATTLGSAGGFNLGDLSRRRRAERDRPDGRRAAERPEGR